MGSGRWPTLSSATTIPPAHSDVTGNVPAFKTAAAGALPGRLRQERRLLALQQRARTRTQLEPSFGPAEVMSRVSSSDSRTQWNATLSPAPAATCRSTQL